MSCNNQVNNTNAAYLNGKNGEYYLLRSNHKGTQSIKTIEGLQTFLTNLSNGIQNLSADHSDLTDLINSLNTLVIDLSTYITPVSLGTLDPSVFVYDQNGFYSDYTQVGGVSFVVSGSVREGAGQIFKFTSDGSNNIGFDSNFESTALYNITNGSTLTAGDYWFYMFSINGKIHLNVKSAT